MTTEEALLISGQPHVRDEQKRLVFESVVNADVVFDTTFVGFWDWEIAHRWRCDDHRFRALLGYQLHELGTEPAKWEHLIHPDDRTRAKAVYRQHITTRGMMPYSHTCRYLHKDGTVFHLFCHGAVVAWSEDGQPLRMRGYYINVTPTAASTR
ncbi:PAS domain S-box-containing protein [Catalinimonas alkaloidigena]|uniref:PAS domain S-box-containing protein n=1 Tax=Catalinimonas alkaloidigena TaxID=1075417 RepID=A0A1G9AXE1_9BACT|nr:PAS domain-containing protein [Catalinimonas alkaloidigena]SDK32001.1 PAS domain S-box-containing protein [Catalinimonas alkaloidigena]